MIREVTTSMIECTSIPVGILPASAIKPLQELQADEQNFVEDVVESIMQPVTGLDAGWLAVGTIPGSKIFLQELQGNFPPPEEPEEPPTCPTCGKSSASVYCSRLPDTDYRLMLRTTGRSRYTALHRVDTQLPPQ